MRRLREVPHPPPANKSSVENAGRGGHYSEETLKRLHRS
jgi:hypothetical protein